MAVIMMPEDKRYKGFEQLAQVLGMLVGGAGMRTFNTPVESRFKVEEKEGKASLTERKPSTVNEKGEEKKFSKWDVFMSNLFPGMYPEVTEWQRMYMPKAAADEALKGKQQEINALNLLTGVLTGQGSVEGVLQNIGSTDLDPKMRQKLLQNIIMMQLIGNSGGKKEAEKK